MWSEKILKRKIEVNVYTLCLFLIVVFVAGLYILTYFRFPVDPQILSYHVRSLHLESTSGQVLLYKGLLGFIAIGCMISLCFPERKLFSYRPSFSYLRLLAFLVLASFLCAWSKYFFDGVLVALIALICFESGVQHRLGINFMGMLKWSSDKRVIFWAFIIFDLSVFVLFMIIPFFTPLDVISPSRFVWIDGHYSGSILPGYNLFSSEDGKLFAAHYGYAMPIVTMFVLKIFSQIGHPVSDLVAVVKIGQLLAFILASLTIFILNKKYSPYIIALAFGVTAFTLSNVGLAVGFPNQSGIRYLPVLVTLVVFALESQGDKYRLYVLAPICALGVVMNPETGIAATLGVLVAVVLHEYKLATPFISMLYATVKFMSLFLVVLSVLYLVTTSVLHKDSGDGLFDFIQLFHGSNYGGKVDKPSLAAVLILFISISTLFRSCWLTITNASTSTVKYEAAVSTMILIWMVYYVNRMAEWNLWFQFLLVVLLVTPRVSGASLNSFFQSNQIGLRSVAIVLLLAGQLASSTEKLPQLARMALVDFQSGCTVQLNGMCLPHGFGSNIVTQLNVLSEFDKSKTIVLSAMPTAVRLRGFNAEFPWAYGMPVIFNKDAQEFTEIINQSGADFVLIDESTSQLAKAMPAKNEHLLSILPMLKSYRTVDRKSGWVVLARRD